ncbi:MAG TPA: GNAT family N-acetyltransferase [Dehalococcoidia bacterium]|nr:GNAT family N-acetyltransferase [Dehalococcoidia bacterium]
MADIRGTKTTVNLRPGRPADAKECGRVCYEAFGAISGLHNFPSDFPSVDVATDLMTMLLSHPRFFSVVAEAGGAIVGSNFLDERSQVAGLGPITVDPKMQDRGIGRRLMQAALDRVTERAFPGVRLLQTAYHRRSLALYSTLGFQPREAIACMQGPAIGVSLAGYQVRRAGEADLEACNRVCMFVHGHHRSGEVLDAIKQGTATVVEHESRVTGYATDLAFFAHAVGETNRDLMALIGAASAFSGPGILVPLRNGALFQWCLGHSLRVVQVQTLMTIGLYNEPAGAYLPSVLY